MPPPAYHQFLVTAPLGRPVVAQGRSPGRLCAEPIGESGERCLLQMILTNIGYAIDATELSAVFVAFLYLYCKPEQYQPVTHCQCNGGFATVSSVY